MGVREQSGEEEERNGDGQRDDAAKNEAQPPRPQPILVALREVRGLQRVNVNGEEGGAQTKPKGGPDHREHVEDAQVDRGVGGVHDVIDEAGSYGEERGCPHPYQTGPQDEEDVGPRVAAGAALEGLGVLETRFQIVPMFAPRGGSEEELGGGKDEGAESLDQQTDPKPPGFVATPTTVADEKDGDDDSNVEHDVDECCQGAGELVLLLDGGEDCRYEACMGVGVNVCDMCVC